MRARSRVIACILAATLLVGACDRGPGTDSTPSDADPPAAADLAAKPEVLLPETAPTGLLVEDLVVGEGEPVTEGATVLVHLVVVALSTGDQVDSTWELGAPRTVQLVPGGAIEGFRAGVTGMQVGGRRHLAVPPDLAYGSVGAPPAVGPNETLVFVVDVLDAG
ncbi:MAG TPA: FKBP-type peptidyl-prolyl cis-trans isomerase [Nitriliruptorales bacterium]